MDTKLILGQEQLALQAKLNLGIYEKRTNYHMCRGKGKKKKGAGKKKGAREDRAQQLEPMAAKGVAYIDSENKKLVHIEDYASHLQGKPSVFAGETGKYLCEQELSITVSADDWIDEFYFNGSDERHRLSDPAGCCTLKRCTLKYDPLAEEGAVLAIAGNDNQPGTSASFGLRVESSAGWKIELSMENAEALGAKVFGIKGPESHDIEVGPMGRPSNMSPPEGWTSNDFDDREWSLPTKSTNGNHFQGQWKMPTSWLDENKYVFYRLRLPKASKILDLMKMDKVVQEQEGQAEVKPIVPEVGLEKASLVSWIEYKEVSETKKKVVLLGYLDGQVDILDFHSKATLFSTAPTNDGIVKGIFFTMKGDKAFFGSFHVKEDQDEEQDLSAPEYNHLNLHILSHKDDKFEIEHSKSISSSHSNEDLWWRRECRMWHATTLVNGDRLLAYNSKREDKSVVVVLDIERSLTEGAFQPEIVLPTDMEAVKICYYADQNAFIVFGGQSIVQRWEMGWSSAPILKKQSQKKVDAKHACMLDEHHLLMSLWQGGVQKLDLRTMNASEAPFPDINEDPCLQVAVSPNGKYIVTGGRNLALVGPSKKVFTLPFGGNWVTELRISNDFVWFKLIESGWCQMPLDLEELPFVADHNKLYELFDDKSGKYQVMEKDETKTMAYIVKNDACKSHSKQDFESLATELTKHNTGNPHFLKFEGLVDEGEHENQKIFLFEHQSLNSMQRWIDNQKFTNKPFSHKGMLDIAMQTSEAIRHCHVDRKIVHGNLAVDSWRVRRQSWQLVLMGDLVTSHLKGESSDISSDINELGMLWAQLIKGSPIKTEEGAKRETFSSTLGTHWDALVESMLAPTAERPDIQKVIASLAQIDELHAEAHSKPFKPDAALLFDAQKEEDKALSEVWKTVGPFEFEQQGKADKEETQLEHYQKVMDGYYEAWRGHDNERKRDSHHRITVTMHQDKDGYFFKVSTTGEKRHTMVNDTTFSYKEGDKTLVDTYDQEKGHWIGADGWNIGRYATFEHSERLASPKILSFQGQDASMIGTYSNKGIEGHGAMRYERTFFEGQFHKGKKHGPGRQIKIGSMSNNITIREGNYVDDLAQGIFRQVKITGSGVRSESSYEVENGRYKLSQ